MNALSLFSGIGGLDRAAEAIGIKTVAMCENDTFCRAVLRKHWPDVPIFKDIKELRGDDIGTPIDVIHGGPPCQPVSLAGRRRGQSDERYLWGDVFQLVANIMPRFCVFENVPGILSIAADDICKELERIGYSVGICCFEAAAVGALHRRMRVFFVGHAERGGLSGQSRRGAGEEPSNGCQDISDANGRGGKTRGQSQIRAWKLGTFGGCPHVSDADSERQQEQRGSEPDDGERAALGCAERGRRRGPESVLGGMAYGLPGGLDGYWDREPDIPRVARGVKNRVNRLRALGNAVVPAQAYQIFRAIVETERSFCYED